MALLPPVPEPKHSEQQREKIAASTSYRWSEGVPHSADSSIFFYLLDTVHSGYQPMSPWHKVIFHDSLLKLQKCGT